MINVKSKTCINPDCKKQSIYNYEGEIHGLYCATHKKDIMINVKSKTCIYSGCKTIPVYNKEGETIGIYCATHKKDDMINVKSKSCIQPNCKKQPSHNYDGTKRAIYCSIHKKDEMINFKNKSCAHSGCKKRPSYNYDRIKRPLYCAVHKKDEMIDVRSKICIHPECKKQPNLNYEGEKQGLYCATHKKDGMIFVKKVYCKSEWCKTCANRKYNGYCLMCFIHLFPGEPNARNYKTKEKATTDYVIEKYPNFTWITDKKIQDGCSKKRPDLLLDLGYQVIIIEVDENQHESYDCSCENKRLMLLSQDIDHRPLVFIRFNPDEYNKKDGKITSCWSLNGKGICTVKKTKQKEWSERLEALKDQIEYWINPENKTDKTIEIVQLFYDCD